MQQSRRRSWGRAAARKSYRGRAGIGGHSVLFTGQYGAQINELVLLKEGEPVVLKHHPNAFRDANLKTLLDEREIRKLTILGAMSHVCIDATVRAAVDFGCDVTGVHDAIATRDLEFNRTEVPANQVHSAYMAALAFAYAKVMPTGKIIHTSE
ncbi:isochorismatase hydrolase [Acetobacter senegalensis]|uniref:Isochorismatase hydrolase n=1 Tax=Acetobacter senegalensis TaxID=446692 RepID=A0A0U4Y654_9PROT|nr:isochorismatase family protein [Acetobacter senegalensis]CEF42398.1 isochorismatase hydrolase [Acetobacter senegalensis]